MYNIIVKRVMQIRVFFRAAARNYTTAEPPALIAALADLQDASSLELLTNASACRPKLYARNPYDAVYYYVVYIYIYMYRRR